VAVVSVVCGYVLYNLQPDTWWAYVLGTSPPVLPPVLEPMAGTNQCNYELLRAFAVWMHEQDASGHGLRYTIGAGTLLGAMRTLHFTQRAGLLPWESDVDIYMPAADAFALVERLQRLCTPESRLGGGRRPAVCDTVEFRGFIDASGGPCCGFGFKLYHRTRRECKRAHHAHTHPAPPPPPPPPPPPALPCPALPCPACPARHTRAHVRTQANTPQTDGRTDGRTDG
jgi:hypothetical protein